MNNEPFISVIMPAYNVGEYIKDSIDSTLNQTYTNFELIIINDGSSDNTEAEIKKFNDPRILYFKNEVNLNLANSLNKGMKLAKGKYIARMDADDISTPDRLQKQVLFLEENPRIGICGSQLEIFGLLSGSMNYPLAQEDLLLRLLITSCFGNNVVMFRKDLLEKHNLYFDSQYTCADDYHCWTRWLLVAEGVNFSESLMKYRIRSNSLSQNREKQHREIKDIRKKYLVNLFSLDSLNEKQLADAFYGPTGLKRIKSISLLLQHNKKKNLFDEKKLLKTVDLLWYSDSLEEIEKRRLVTFFTFPLIFKLGFLKNIKRYFNLYKHYYITGRPPYKN